MPCQGRTVTSVTGLLHVSPSAAPHFLLSANQSIHPLRAASICLTIRLPIIRQGKGGLSCFDDYCINVCDESRGGCLPAWQSPTTCMVALPCHGTSVLSDPSRLAIVSSSQHERAGLRVTAYDRLSVPVILRGEILYAPRSRTGGACLCQHSEAQTNHSRKRNFGSPTFKASTTEVSHTV